MFKVFFSVYLPLKIRGKEHVPSRGGFIVAGNHVSFLDPIVFGVACPRPLHFMARDTLFKNAFFAWILKEVHAFPLKRKAADLGAIKEALRRLKSGRGLLLFPEGARAMDGEIGEGLSGVGFLARKSGLPVIPAYVEGTQRAMPKGAKKIKSGPLEVLFGEPITFSEADGLTDAERARKIMEKIAFLRLTKPGFLG